MLKKRRQQSKSRTLVAYAYRIRGITVWPWIDRLILNARDFLFELDDLLDGACAKLQPAPYRYEQADGRASSRYSNAQSLRLRSKFGVCRHVFFRSTAIEISLVKSRQL